MDSNEGSLLGQIYAQGLPHRHAGEVTYVGYLQRTIRLYLPLPILHYANSKSYGTGNLGNAMGKVGPHGKGLFELDACARLPISSQAPKSLRVNGRRAKEEGFVD